MTVYSPADEQELAALTADAYAARRCLAIRGGGTLDGIGRAGETDHILATDRLSGITLYEPAEMVIGARAGTRLDELVATLEQKGQMLPFEPADWRAMLATSSRHTTVGGMAAANLSGPRRIHAGACRDSLIGVRFVNGRGEIVKSGGRVMKNVTGYDLSKLLAGSWGTLGVFTELVFKVLPKPETSASMVWKGLDDQQAVALMSAALGSPFEVSAAAHLPASGQKSAQTVVRLENFVHSVTSRADKLNRALVGQFGTCIILPAAECAALWRQIGSLAPLMGQEGALWRISIAPSRAAGLVRDLRLLDDMQHYYDWGGGLVWLLAPEHPDHPARINALCRRQGGHAMLVRASAGYRTRAFCFGPGPGTAAAMLHSRVKAAFDPADILNRGRLSPFINTSPHPK